MFLGHSLKTHIFYNQKQKQEVEAEKESENKMEETCVSVGKGDTSIGVSSWQSDYSRQYHFTFQQHTTRHNHIDYISLG